MGGLFKDSVPVSFDGKGTDAASSLLMALDDISDAAQGHVLLKPLDATGLPLYCDESCLEKSAWVRGPPTGGPQIHSSLQ